MTDKGIWTYTFFEVIVSSEIWTLKLPPSLMKEGREVDESNLMLINAIRMHSINLFWRYIS